MKMIRISALLLALTLFAACGEKSKEASQNTTSESVESSSEIITESETSSDLLFEPESSESTVSGENNSEESEEPTPTPTPDIIPEDFVVGTPADHNWDYMVSADAFIWGYTPTSTDAEHRCFTVQDDGKWGLIDENGNWLLPCAADQPIAKCSMGHWIFQVDGWIPDNNEYDTFSTLLKERELAPLCDGHGGDNSYHFVNTDNNTIPMDFITIEGCIDFRDISASELAVMDYEPAYFAGVETTELGEKPASNGYWNFVNGRGDLLVPDMEFDLVGEFGDEALAPVCLDGKWAYVDKNGVLATAFIYDSCWHAQKKFDAETEYLAFPVFAYCLDGGFAPVLRDGKWGVIDSTGTEVVPCEYEGAAPLSGGAWLKKDGIWTKQLLK